MDTFVPGIVNAAKLAHADGWEKARESIPALDANELITMVSEVFTSEEGVQAAALKAAQELAGRYKKPAELYLKAFSVSLAANGLKQVKAANFSELGNEQFVKAAAAAAKKIGETVEAYSHKEIDEVQLIHDLCETGIIDVGEQLLAASGVDIEAVKSQISAVTTESAEKGILMVTFAASAEAYKILSGALKDASQARETRILIEEECNNSIAMMRQYREQMNSRVSDYLFARTETFNAGVEAMDRAILEGDVDGFISGNVMIQDILNYRVQFRNSEEFDALMDSDEAFRL